MNITSYSISISKEQLSAMPAVEFPGAITVIENRADAVKALEYLSTCGVVGFDTETKPTFRKGQTNSVALIQMSTLDHSYLFRLNKLGFCEELKAFMESETPVKVGLSLHDDFHVLHRIAEFEAHGFVDLQSVVKSFHITDLSLQKIYAILFHARISKSQRLSNWEASQLSVSQMLYASIDAWACLRIYLHLMDGCFDPAESEFIVTETPSDSGLEET